MVIFYLPRFRCKSIRNAICNLGKIMQNNEKKCAAVALATCSLACLRVLYEFQLEVEITLWNYNYAFIR